MFNSIVRYCWYNIHLVFKFFSTIFSLINEIRDLMARTHRVSYSAVGSPMPWLVYVLYSYVNNIVCLTMIEHKKKKHSVLQKV